MNILFIITSSLFFLWILRDIFFWLSLWQENEYRVDRFFASLKTKEIKKKIFLSPLFLPKWILFFAFVFVIFNDSYVQLYQYGIVTLYIAQLLFIGYELYRMKLRRPFLQVRSLLLMVLTGGTLVLFFSIPLFDAFFWLLLLDLSVPFIVTAYVLIFSFPVEIYLDWQLNKALATLRNNPDLLVIAVTGSTGKSLMTEYIAKILQHKFNVVRTQRANNTYEELSRTILSRIHSGTEVFVAELKAYKPGEIRMLCELIKPTIGVLTPITYHYLTLFKTVEAIKKTNNELVTSLPKKGYCLFPGNNKETLSLYSSSKKQKYLYLNSDTYKGSSNSLPATSIQVSEVKHTAKRTACTITLRGKRMRITLPRIQDIEYVLPGIFIADALGMKEEEIKRALRNLH